MVGFFTYILSLGMQGHVTSFSYDLVGLAPGRVIRKVNER